MRSHVWPDICANVDRSRQGRVHYWLKVVGKALVAPQVHAVVLYRIASALARTPLRPLGFALRAVGLVWSGAEIHPDARIGPGLALVHSHGVVVGAGVVIGADCRLSQGATLGEPGRGGDPARWGFPVLGDGVTVGAHAVVLGPHTIGDHAVIGANSVVTSDVPAGAVVGGIPARVLTSDPPRQQ